MDEASEGGEQGFRRKYYEARLLILLAVLFGLSLWWSNVTIDENRPVDWSESHRIQLCPLVAPGAEFGWAEDEEERERVEARFAGVANPKLRLFTRERGVPATTRRILCQFSPR